MGIHTFLYRSSDIALILHKRPSTLACVPFIYIKPITMPMFPYEPSKCGGKLSIVSFNSNQVILVSTIFRKPTTFKECYFLWQ